MRKQDDPKHRANVNAKTAKRRKLAKATKRAQRTHAKP
jgi:hypothetical protein